MNWEEGGRRRRNAWNDEPATKYVDSIPLLPFPCLVSHLQTSKFSASDSWVQGKNASNDEPALKYVDSILSSLSLPVRDK